MTVRIATCAWALQMVAMAGSLILALCAFESIIFTGPLLSIAGLVLAAIACRLQSVTVLVHGLSAPVVCAFGAMLISANQWGPTPARAPITIILVLYTVLCLPLAALAFIRIRWPILPAAASGPPWWQFSLRSMLFAMTTVCVSIAVGRLLFKNVVRADYVAFGGYAIACVALSAYVSWRFYVSSNAVAQPH